MADTQKRVAYRVKKPVFVNGSRVVPGTLPDDIVYAEPGLEGSALELVKGKAASAAAKAGDGKAADESAA